jgi:predicted DNA-binding transcriptional regulator YafY
MIPMNARHVGQDLDILLSTMTWQTASPSGEPNRIEVDPGPGLAVCNQGIVLFPIDVCRDRAERGAAMHDDVPIKRHWILLRTLCARRLGMSVREMALEMGVAEKTIRRDLELFRRLGFPLVETNGERGRKTWRLTDGGGLPPLQFTFDEALVIYLARPFLEPLAGTQLWEAAHSAFRKIKATLNEPALAYLERFPRLFHYTTAGFGDYTKKAALIDALTLAIEDRKAIHITYQSQGATEPATRDVYPYGLVRHRGSLYLIAFAPEHDQVRLYKIDRIESVAVDAFTFQRPRDFDMAKHLAGSFGIYDGDHEVTVVVKFLPAAARYVLESRWHRSQVLTRQRDGSLLARFQLSSTVEIKSWVLGFGGSAVVLEPEELRAEIARELEQMIQFYHGEPVKT